MPRVHPISLRATVAIAATLAVVVTACLAAGAETLSQTGSPSPSDTTALFERLDSDGDGLLSTEEVPAEKRRMLARLMRTSDADNDGRLTESEFANAITPRRPEKSIEELRKNKVPGADAFAVVMANLDQNHDGRITPAEVPDKWTRAFDVLAEKADQNKDGVLSRNEINRAGPKLARASIQIARRFKLDIDAEMARIGPAAMRAMERSSSPVGEPTPEKILRDPVAAVEMFELADENGDGQIELSEIPENRRERFERLAEHADDNLDGKLNKREFVSGMKTWARLEIDRKKKGKNRGSREKDKAGPNATKILKRIRAMDQDRDEKISLDEARGHLKDHFDRVDANGDGQLDRRELKQMANQIGRRNRSRSDE